MIAGKNPNL